MDELEEMLNNFGEYEIDIKEYDDLYNDILDDMAQYDFSNSLPSMVELRENSEKSLVEQRTNKEKRK